MKALAKPLTGEHTAAAADQAVLPVPSRRTGLGQLGRRAAVTALMLADLTAMALAAAAALGVRLWLLPAIWPELHRELPDELLGHMAWALAVTFGCLAYERLYSSRYSFWREAYQMLKAVSFAALIVFAGVALARISGEVSRSVLLLWYLFSIFLLPATRYVVKPALARAGIWEEPVLLMGAGKTGELVVKALSNSGYRGIRIAAVLDDDPTKRVKGLNVNGRHYSVIGGFADAPHIIRASGIESVIIAAPGMDRTRLVELVNCLQAHTRYVTIIPDLIGVPVATGEATYFFDEEILAYRHKNNLAHPGNRAVKRAFDLVLGSIALILAAPFMLVIAAAVKLTSPGPVFYSHRRIGQGGREFMCHKFRTMVVNNEEILKNYLNQHPQARKEWEKYAKLRGYDPRLTPVGGLLRKWSLDELPQIFNVLKGEMSLVGPRPYLPRELAKMGPYLPIMILAKPGITGLWQVSGRNEVDFEGRLELESRYVRNWSLWLDITLIFRTIPAVLKRDGAY